MDEEQKKLRKKMTNALRERSKHENRYFKLRTEYEARYGDKVLANGLEKKIAKKKSTTKKKKEQKPSPVIADNKKKQKKSKPVAKKEKK